MPCNLSARIACLALLLSWAPGPAGAGGPGISEAQNPKTLALLPIRLLDTSGEPVDQREAHAARQAALGRSLADRLAGIGASVRPIGAAALAAACPDETSACLLAAADAAGAGRVFVGVVHKSSSLILQMFARIVDTRTGAVLFVRELNFRGDTDESWERMADFLSRQMAEDPALAVK